MTPALSRGIRRRQQKDFEGQLKAMGCDPTEILVAIATDNVPCSECKGRGRRMYKLPDMLQNKPCKCLKGAKADEDCKLCSGLGIQLASERVCQSCWGDLREVVTPDVRGKYSLAMLNKLVPDLRSVAHTNADGDSLPVGIQVVLVRAGDAVPALEVPAKRLTQ